MCSPAQAVVHACERIWKRETPSSCSHGCSDMRTPCFILVMVPGGPRDGLPCQAAGAKYEPREEISKWHAPRAGQTMPLHPLPADHFILCSVRDINRTEYLLDALISTHHDPLRARLVAQDPCQQDRTSSRISRQRDRSRTTGQQGEHSLLSSARAHGSPCIRAQPGQSSRCMSVTSEASLKPAFRPGICTIPYGPSGVRESSRGRPSGCRVFNCAWAARICDS